MSRIEKAQQLMDLLGVKDSFLAIMRSVISREKPLAGKRAIDEALLGIQGRCLPTFLADAAEIYARVYENDLDLAIAFYGSEIGKRCLDHHKAVGEQLGSMAKECASAVREALADEQ